MHTAVNTFRERQPFLQIGSITVTNGVLAVTARDETSVDALADANKVIYEVGEGVPALEFRFRTDGSDGDDTVLEVYAKPKTGGSNESPEHYTRIGTLTMIQGTQDSNSEHFIDEITVSNAEWPSGPTAITTTNEIGRVLCNTYGYEKLVFVASTRDTTTIYVDVKKHDKEF